MTAQAYDDTGITTAYGAAVDIAALDNDSGIGALTPANYDNAAHGSVTFDSGTNHLTYTPNTGFSGDDSFTYDITDEDSSTPSTGTVSLHVNGRPLGTDDEYSTGYTTGLSVYASGVLGNDSDPESSSLSADIASGPSHSSSFSLNSDGSFNYTPAGSFWGDDSFTYTASDGTDSSDPITVTIHVGRDPDWLEAHEDSFDTNEDVGFDPALTGNDDLPTNNNQTLELVSGPSHGTLDGWHYTPEANYFGADSFSYRIYNGSYSSTAGVSITIHPVNDAPTPGPDELETAEDESIDISGADLVGNDGDVEGDALAFDGIESGPSHGTLTNHFDGTYTYVPNADFNGSDSFVYRVTDSHDAVGYGTVNITVAPVNDSPVGSDAEAWTHVDAAFNFSASDLLAWSSPSDVDGDSVTIGEVGGATWNGSSYSFSGSTPGDAEVTFTLVDGNGGSTPRTLTMHVLPAVAPQDDAPDIDEDGQLSGNVLANDSPEGLTVTPGDGPSHGQLQLNSDGSFTYTPDSNFAGSDSFSYTAHDAHGGSGTATVTISVNPVNDAPWANDESSEVSVTHNQIDSVPLAGVSSAAYGDIEGDSLSVTYGAAMPLMVAPGSTGSTAYTVTDPSGASATANVSLTVNIIPNRGPATVNDDVPVAEDDSTTFDVRSNDTDADGDTFSVSITGGPSHGSAVLNGDGTITYTPEGDYFGADSLTYSIDDGWGGTATGTVNITVSAVNDSPSFTPGPDVTVGEDSGTYSAGWATGISTGPANEGQTPTFSVTGNTNPGLFTSGGQPAITADGNLTFTLAPDAPFSNTTGSALVTVELSDGEGGSATASFTINVTPVNDAPTGVASQAQTIDEDASYTTPAASDLENDPLTIVVLPGSGPAHGTIHDNGDGTLTYTPGANRTDPVSFQYKVVDAGGAESDVATVNLSFTPVNDPPVGAPDSYSPDEDTELSVAAAGVLANDADIEGDALTAVLVDGPTNAQSFTLNADGSFSYLPNSDFYGEDSFTYKVSDGQLESAPVTVSIHVAAVNDAPRQVLPASPMVAFGQSLTLAGESAIRVVDDATGAIQVMLTVDRGTLTLAQTTGLTFLTGDGTGDWFVCVSGTVAAVNAALDGLTYQAPAGYIGDVHLTMATQDLGGTGSGGAKAAFDTLTIQAVPTAGVVANQPSYYEPNGPAAFTVTLTHASDKTITVDFEAQDGTAVAGEDYDATSGTLTFAPGQTTKTVYVNIVDDELIEDTENFLLALVGGTNVLVGNPASTEITSDDPVNDPPAIGLPSVAATDEDTVLVFSTANGNAISVSDPDAGDETVRVVVSSTIGGLDAPNAGSELSVTGAGSGTLTLEGSLTAINAALEGMTFTAPANYDESVTLTVDINDLGHSGSGGAKTAHAECVITVNPVDDAPVAVDDSFNIAEDGTLTGDEIGLLDNDSDADGDWLWAELASDPQHGQAYVGFDGWFEYVPDPDYFGSDSFTYTITDGITVRQATVNITVDSVNDAATLDAIGATQVAVATTWGSTRDAGDWLRIGDVDSAAVQVTLAAQHGQMGLLSHDGLTLSGVTGDVANTTLIMSGSVADLNAALAGLFYVPDVGYDGADELSIAVIDEEGLAAAGDPLTQSIAIDVMPAVSISDVTVDEEAGTATLTVSLASASSRTVTLDWWLEDGTAELGADYGEAHVDEQVRSHVVYDYHVHYEEPADGYFLRDYDATRPANGYLVTTYLDQWGNQQTYWPPMFFEATDPDPSWIMPTSATQDVFDHHVVGYWVPATDSSTPWYSWPGGYDSQIGTIVHDFHETRSEPDATWPDGSIVDAVPSTIVDETLPAQDGYEGSLTFFAGQTSRTITVAIPNDTLREADKSFNLQLANLADGLFTKSTGVVTIHNTDANNGPAAQNDSYLLVEDEARLVATGTGLLANDTDADGDALTAVLVTGPTHGTLNLAADGAFSYTPSLNYNGADSFTYKAVDGHGGEQQRTVNLTITPVNDAPTTGSYQLTTGVNGALQGNVLSAASDTETPGGLSAYLNSEPAHGSVSLSTNGLFVYTPNSGYQGVDSFSFRVSDGMKSAVGEVRIEVGGVVRGATIDVRTASTPGSAQLTSSGLDVSRSTVDAQPITHLKIVSVAGGELFNHSGNPIAAGDYVAIADATTAAGEPWGLRFKPTLDSYADGTIVVQGGVLEAGVFTAVGSSESVNVDVRDVPIVGFPAANFTPGTDTYPHTLEDTPIDGITFGMNAGHASGINGVRLLAIEGGTLYAHGSTTPISVGGFVAATVNSAGGLTFKPDRDRQSPAVFTLVSAYDNGTTVTNVGDAVTSVVMITAVDDAPQTTSLHFDIEGARVIAREELLAGAVDADGSSLTVTVDAPVYGTLESTAEGWLYTAPNALPWETQLTYHVSDGVQSTSGTATLTVNPILMSAVAQTVGGVIQYRLAPAHINAAKNATLSDGTPFVQYFIGDVVEGGTVYWDDGTQVTTGGSRFVPATADSHGDPQGLYFIRNGSGPGKFTVYAMQVDANNAHIQLGAGQEVEVPALSMPTFAGPTGHVLGGNHYITDEDTPLDGIRILSTDVVGSVSRYVLSEITGGELYLPGAATPVAVGGFISSAVAEASGGLQFRPSADFTGTASLTVRAVDAAGSALGTFGRLLIEVTPVQEPALARPDAYSVAEDGVLEISNVTVVANDDADGFQSATIVVPPEHGTFDVSTTDYFFNYRPDKNYFGEDSFVYRITDSSGHSSSAAVSITVTPVNDAPEFSFSKGQTWGPEVRTNLAFGSFTVEDWMNNVNAGASNESDQTLTTSISNDNTWLFSPNGQPAIAADGTLSFTAANAGTANVTVTLTDSGDTVGGGVRETTKTFRIVVDPAPTPEVDPVTGQPDPDPLPYVGLMKREVTVDEDKKEVKVKVRLSEAAESATAVYWQTVNGVQGLADVDYKADGGILVFAAGETEKEIVVKLIDDEIPWINELEGGLKYLGQDFGIILTGAEGAQIIDGYDRTTVDVIDDDVSVSISGTGTTFTVTKVGRNDRPFEVHYELSGDAASDVEDPNNGVIRFEAVDDGTFVQTKILELKKKEDSQDWQVDDQNSSHRTRGKITFGRIDLEASDHVIIGAGPTAVVTYDTRASEILMPEPYSEADVQDVYYDHTFAGKWVLVYCAAANVDDNIWEQLPDDWQGGTKPLLASRYSGTRDVWQFGGDLPGPVHSTPSVSITCDEPEVSDGKDNATITFHVAVDGLLEGATASVEMALRSFTALIGPDVEDKTATLNYTGIANAAPVVKDFVVEVAKDYLAERLETFFVTALLSGTTVVGSFAVAAGKVEEDPRVTKVEFRSLGPDQGQGELVPASAKEVRFFPDPVVQFNSDGTPVGSSVSTGLNIVRVKATVTGLKEGDRVYFRSYDVDDSTSDKLIDLNEAAGNDNLGRLDQSSLHTPGAPVRQDEQSDKKGFGYSGQMRGIGLHQSAGINWDYVGNWSRPNTPQITSGLVKEENGTFYAEADLLVSFQPGDNFRVLAYPGRFSDDPDDKNVPESVASKMSTDVSDTGKSIPSGAMASPILTVWRKLHVELDQMKPTTADGKSIGDSITLTAALASTEPVPGAGMFAARWKVELKMPTTVPQILTVANKFEGGWLEIEIEGQKRFFKIVSTRGGGGAFSPNYTVYFDAPVGIPGFTPPAGAMIRADQLVTLYSDDFDVAGSLEAGFSPVLKVDPSKPGVYTDLQGYAKASFVRTENRFADAFILPEYDIATTRFNSLVPGNTHIAADFGVIYDATRGSKAVETLSPSLYWATYVLAGFDYSEGLDYDPDFDNPAGTEPRVDIHIGDTFGVNEISGIWLETIRDVYDTGRALPVGDKFRTAWKDMWDGAAMTFVHEIGHQLLAGRDKDADADGHRKSTDNIMMAVGSYRVPTSKRYFVPEDILSFRLNLKTGGPLRKDQGR